MRIERKTYRFSRERQPPQQSVLIGGPAGDGRIHLLRTWRADRARYTYTAIVRLGRVAIEVRQR